MKHELLIIGTLTAVGLYATSAIWQSLPLDLKGSPVIVDGDTLSVDGHRIRLLGIDTPEMGQVCTSASGETFRCGEKARQELVDFISRRPVECRTRGKDPYGRYLAFCSVEGHDLGRFLITRGWAVAYGDASYRYVSDERMARTERTGLWAGFFDQPAAWRQMRRVQK